MSRYELCKFNPAPDPELICGICINVLDTPYETVCRHVFCCDCIVTALRENSKCPICRAPCKEDELKEVLPLVQNLINKLTMKCDNFDNGCVDLILKEFFLDHIKSCEFAMVQCRYTKCGQILLRRHCTEHETNTCAYRDHLCEGGCGLMVPQENLDSHDCIKALLTCVKDLKEKNLELQKNLDELKKAQPNDVKFQSVIPVSDSPQGDLSSSVIMDDGSFSISPETFSSYEWSETEMTDFEYESNWTGQRRSRRLAMLGSPHDSAPDRELSDNSNQSQDSQDLGNDDYINEDNTNIQSSHTGNDDYSNEDNANIRSSHTGNDDYSNEDNANGRSSHTGNDNNGDAVVETSDYQMHCREDLSPTRITFDATWRKLHRDAIDPTRTQSTSSIVTSIVINRNRESYVDCKLASPEGCSQILDNSDNSPALIDSSGNCMSQKTNRDHARPEKRLIEENPGEPGGRSGISKIKRSRQASLLECDDTHSQETVLVSGSSSVPNTSNSKPALKKHTHGQKKRKLESHFVADNQTPMNSNSGSSVLDEAVVTSDQTSDTVTTPTNTTPELSSPDIAVNINASTNNRNEHNQSSSRRGPLTRSQGHDQHNLLETNIIQNVKVPPSMADLLSKYTQDDDSSSDESWSPSHEI